MCVVICINSMEPKEKPLPPSLGVVEVVAEVSVPFRSYAVLCAHHRFCSGLIGGCTYIVYLTVRLLGRMILPSLR
jgi:hypothetical protein